MALQHVSNTEVRAYYTYAVYGPESTVIAFDVIGSEAEVKAIIASLRLKKPLKFDGSWRPRKPWGDTKIVKTTLRLRTTTTPPLYRWHVLPIITEGDAIIPVWGWDEVLPREQAFIGALARWTVWPVLPEWASALMTAGASRGLIQTLRADGVDYAYLIDTAGWDKVINTLLERGELRI